MLGDILRRLTKLHRLLWLDERVSVLETKNRSLTKHGLNVSQRQLVALKDRADAIQRQLVTMKDRADAIQRQLVTMKNRTDAIQREHRQAMQVIKHSVDQIDLLKSKLEVPDELIDEFQNWKARNQVPEQPLTTVIIATYNRARLLTERSIPSVLGQTHNNLELIVVGDGCTDETEEMVSAIHDPRLTFVNLPERGSYPTDAARRWMVAGTLAMNKGLSMASGDYITHLDDDDEYSLERLEKLVSFAAENECDFVWHPFWWEDAGGRWKENKAQEFALRHVTTSSVFYRSWFKKVQWNIKAHQLMEPGDWNRFRRIKYIGPVSMRYPELLLRHYRERGQS